MALDRIGYYPDVEGLDSVRGTAEYHRVLLVGQRAEDIRTRTAFRFHEAGAELSAFPVGIYWKIVDDRLDAMVLSDEIGADPEPSEESVLAHADADGLGALGLEWLNAYWDTAVPIDAPRYAKGDLTVHRATSRDATVEKRTLTLTGQPVRAVWNYRVKTEGKFVTVSEDTLEPAADSTDLHSLLDSEPGTARGFGATLTHSKLSLGVTDAIFSYKATKSMYLPYQFKPVLKFLNTSAQRMLIADEVGLGKTVEAGLLWTEMAARNQANRVLVICPSALVVKWQQEMLQRFGFELERLDGPGLRTLSEKVANGKAPKEYAYVVSLQTLARAADARALLTESDFTTDLCIVDEAHQLRNPSTAAHDAGEDVSLWSPALVLLTATPLNLGNHDLLSLIQLLMPGEVRDLRDLEERIEHHEPLQNIVRSVTDRTASNIQRRRWLNEIANSPLGAALRQRTAFQDLRTLLAADQLAIADVPRLRRDCSDLHGLSAVVTRTKKSEVRQDRTVRHAVPIEVDWTEAERRFYDDYKEWVRQEARNNEIPTGFALQMPLRLAGSCLRATARTVLRRSAIEPELTEDDWALASRPAAGSFLGEAVPPHQLVADAQAVLRVDRKYDALLRRLQTPEFTGRQALLFTFFRNTADYLTTRLAADGLRVASLHGGVPNEDRQRIIAEFREGKYDIVVATKVASEGLDFEFCSVVVNYDLPWNPMEVEQRIGRIDRLGQKSEKINILNLVTPGTIETDIFLRLMNRTHVFEHAIGELDEILGEEFQKASEAVLEFSLSEEERQQRINQSMMAVEQHRADNAAVSDAAAFLQAGDDYGIDAIEQRIARGRYLGQAELAGLVAEWAAGRGGSTEIDPRAQEFRVDFAQEMHEAVVEWRRSLREVPGRVRELETAPSLTFSLNAEEARQHDMRLLSGSHPLIRAVAYSAKEHRITRFGNLRVRCVAGCEPGLYAVAIASTRWQGLRPTSELWVQAVDLDSGEQVEAGVEAALFAALANGELLDCRRRIHEDFASTIKTAFALLDERRIHEEQKRRADNEALTEERRIRAQRTRDRQVEMARERLAQNRINGNHTMDPAIRGKIRKAEQRYNDEISLIDGRAASSLDLDQVAICQLQVVPA